MIALFLRSLGRKALGYALFATALLVALLWYEHQRQKLAAAEVALAREKRRRAEENVALAEGATSETAARVTAAENRLAEVDARLKAAHAAREAMRTRVTSLLAPDLEERARKAGV